MGRRLMIASAAVGVFVLVGLAALVYDHSRRSDIAPGVRIAGIDVGGMNSDAAALKLRDRLEAPLRQAVVVTAAGRRFSLTPTQAGVQIDIRGVLDAAVRASRGGWFLSRAVRDLTGGHVSTNIQAAVTYSHPAVRQLVAAVAAAVNRKARNAAVKPGANGLTQVPERRGVAINATALGRQIELAITRPSFAHEIAAPTRTLVPRITRAELAARYPAYIVIDRQGFRLRFFQHLKLAATYPISVGRQGLETPAGLYDVQWKEVNPPWHVPNDSWAGSLAGQTIPPGPADPIKARWMAFNGGAGIHGTAETASIGHAASHGCVRMLIPDVISLYARSPVGTPVYVV